LLGFRNEEGQVIFHLSSRDGAREGVHLVQVEMVLRDGFFATERDVQIMLEGVYVVKTGSLRLWSHLGDALVPVQDFQRINNFSDIEVPARNMQFYGPALRPGQALSSACFMVGRLSAEPEPEQGEVQGDGDGDDDDKNMNLIGTISSPACGMQVHVNSTSLNFAKYYVKATHYTLMVSLASFLQMVFLVRQMEYSGTQANSAKISLLTIGQQGVMDAYLMLLHLFTGIFIEALFTAFATTAFFKFIIFSLFEMRYLLMIWKARRPQGFNDGWEQMRRELSSLYSRFYGFLLGGIIVFYMLQAHIRFLAVLLYSFWIPQIIHSAQHGHRRPLQPMYVVGISVTRLGLPLYFFWCPKNWLHTATMPGFALFLCFYVACQAGVLLLQHRFGPRCFVPRQFWPDHYDYYRPLPSQEMTEVGGGGAVDCVICMCPVTGGTTAVTPCDHVFHLSCLRQWMDIKMECPTCRRPVPEFVD